MSLPSSGSITPRSTARTSSEVGRAAAGTTRILPVASRVNSTGHAGATPTSSATARAAEGARRQHPLRDLPRARARARPAGHRGDRRHARAARQHRAPPPRPHARGRPARRGHRRPGCRRSPAAPLLARGRRAVARLRAARVPRAGPDAPPARRHRRRAGRRRRRGRPRAGRRRGRRPDRRARAPRRSPRSWPPSGFDPESVVDDDGATIAFTRCPFRELAEANPDLVCSLHRGLGRGLRRRPWRRRGGGVPRSGRPHAVPGRDRDRHAGSLSPARPGPRRRPLP